MLKPTVLVFTLLIASLATATPLYVGANYAPHDGKDPEKISREIAMMKDAGFNVVRVGHLAWDSYETDDGVYDFEWFDAVMDNLHAAGISVLLDIPIRPAPLWLHRKYPGIDIVDASGARLYPNHRYMDDMGDPDYQRHALRFAEAMVKRYAEHPAVIAFGIDNESGDGMYSYSDNVLKRFREWLKVKYGTPEALDKAWAGQRWSRRITSFDDVGLPMSGDIQGPPERVLDFKRFASEETSSIILGVLDIVKKYGKGKLANTNAWYFSRRKYFDYAPIAYSGLMTREGCGFYPGSSLKDPAGMIRTLFEMTRIQYEQKTPFWCTEFITMGSTPGVPRRSAYATLMYGSEMACAWLWQSMWNGEEQYLEGLVDWDGEPNRSFDEFKRIATEFKKIEKFFPYTPKPEIGIAYTYDSQIHSAAYPEKHESQAKTCFDLCFENNLDVAWLDPARSEMKYKMLFIPGLAVMDEKIAANIRRFVEEGGVAVMTSNSAVVDQNARVFDTTRPGLLSDVFGIRVGHYEQTKMLNELPGDHPRGTELKIATGESSVTIKSDRFDYIEPRGAEVLSSIVGFETAFPIVTSHHYGKGKAVYIGIPARKEVLRPIFASLVEELGVAKQPKVPAGVMVRQIDANHILYLNLKGKPAQIKVGAPSKSLISDRELGETFKIPAYEPEFIEMQSVQ